MFASFKSLVLASVAAFLFASTAFAGTPACDTKPECPPRLVAVVKYVKVVCPVEKEVPYTCTVVKYDHCGKPYKVEVTKYKTITVEVEKLVKVVEYVSACK